MLCPWSSPGKSTRVGSHSLLQGIFPTQGSNLDLLHCRQILYHVSIRKALTNFYPLLLHQLHLRSSSVRSWKLGIPAIEVGKNVELHKEILLIFMDLLWALGFPSGSDGKESAHNVGYPGSIPGSGISSGGGNETHSSILA